MQRTPVLITLSLLALSSPVFAQVAPDASPSGTGGISGWPAAIADRPYNLNGGMLELHGSLPIFSFSGDTFALAGVGGAFGISDALELGADYAFEVSPDADAAGVLAGHALFRVAHSGQLSAAVGMSALYSHSADGIVLAGGLSLRYRLSPQLSLYTTTSGVPICGGCLHILGPVTGQLLVAIPSGGGDTEVALNLPIGIGIQATPQLYLFAETSLATFELSPDTARLTELSDYAGINVGAWFAPNNRLELGGSFADDLKHAGDLYVVELMARIYL